MTHDILIRNGMIADGTGADPTPGDIAIDGDTITAVGNVDGDGAEVIDAEGCLVTPGFVDLHTHLDAQIGWDPMLTPISWHGVTTALLGNCGVAFAPCKPEDRETIAAMMESVEDIPRDAILSGLPWSWEHYGGYLDALESMNPAINVAGMVGHCALRYYVMGDRSITDQPTAEELDQIVRLAGDSVRAGAVGFSTNRFLGHYMPDGRHVPGTHAAHDEVVAIAEAVGGAGGMMQNVCNFGGDFTGEAELLRKEAHHARVLFSTTAGDRDTSGQKVKAMVEALNADGLDANTISVPRSTGGIVGLACGLPWTSGAWQELSAMLPEVRLEAIRNVDFANRLIEEAKAIPPEGRPGTPVRPARDLFWMGDGPYPDYLCGPEQSLAALAEAAGEHPAETFLRMSKDSNGKTLFTHRMFNKNLKAVRNLFNSEYVLPSLGDAGAHVSQVMDSGWATFVLRHWCRDEGMYSVGDAVRRITSAPARIIGLDDRGVLAAGKRADINVFSLDRLAERMPEIVHDFPGGAPRFIQRGEGYQATICNGIITLRDDELTGARGGRVLRNGA
jgi:N-acyl-D-amino-acid deacylase